MMVGTEYHSRACQSRYGKALALRESRGFSRMLSTHDREARSQGEGWDERLIRVVENRNSGVAPLLPRFSPIPRRDTLTGSFPVSKRKDG